MKTDNVVCERNPETGNSKFEEKSCNNWYSTKLYRCNSSP